MKRRDFLKKAGTASAATAAMTTLSAGPFQHVFAASSAPGVQTFGKAAAFSFDTLKQQAKELSSQPYDGSIPPLPETLAQLSRPQFDDIHYRNESALWSKSGTKIRAEFFHLSPFFRRPVSLYEVSQGQARQLRYSPDLYDFGRSGVNAKVLPEDLGFAGVRYYLDKDWDRDVVSFLGASYFRAVGKEMQYGLSARGLAINTAMDTPEEFPDFVSFWLERPQAKSKTTVLYALLDSPSTTGAYRFEMTLGDNVVMHVTATLYPRKDISRLGIAPITSMFMVGENDRRTSWDWRPEIHDSDGLAMWKGNGEWIWRPLTNPRHLGFNVFTDTNPKGFGLMQRDRKFDHYQDNAFHYETRPDLWVEPLTPWGEGSIQLVEIPTLDETFDNVVCYWNPKTPLLGGQEFSMEYNLHWGTRPPYLPERAMVVATYTGLGGEIGQRRDHFSQHFTIDFAGGALNELPSGAQIDPVITLSNGQIERLSVTAQPQINGYRVMFDLVPPDDSENLITIRMYIKNGDQALSETFLYQWAPPPASERLLHNPGHL
ncbi:glucan biosynthesis protein [Pokkaliibacter sp. CJK22405]|uniref:glucan biosynthesis protein n=1 Tax=Pokkaliibacter sp. CJK22405 TaxID=3384615 RepID=UPI003984B6D9